MAIFGTFRPYLLMELFWLYLSVIDVKQMRLSQLFEKMMMVLLPKNHQKIENTAILCIMIAILGHFSRVSSDDPLDICFSDQQDFTESTLVLYISRYSVFRPDVFIPLGPEKCQKYNTQK